MGSPKPREERRNTFLRARLRSEHGWSDVTIANVSSRGLMLQCVAPLQRNCFVEVRHRHITIVGRIVWVGGPKCGVRTQDVIDVAGLLSQRPRQQRKPGEERRAMPRTSTPRPRAAVAERVEASRRFARVFDWAIVMLAGGAAAAFMAQSAWAALSQPLAQVGTALAGNG